MKVFLIFLFVWAIISSLGYCVINFSPDDSRWENRWENLAKNGVQTYGTVTSKDPDNHAAVNYVYKVGDREFDGAGHAGGGNPGFDEIQVGQSVMLYYDPKNPSDSFLGGPQYQIAGDKLLRSRATAALFVISFLAIFPIYFAVYMATRKKTS